MINLYFFYWNKTTTKELYINNKNKYMDTWLKFKKEMNLLTN